jgi:serine/threonine protein kinase
MKETTHPSVGLLQAFDRGTLAPGEWSAIEEHLASCPACGQTLANLPGLTLNEVVKELLDGTETLLSQAPAAAIPAPLADHPRYEVLRLLGAGGVGQVFLARHRLMDRMVALKVLRPSMLADPAAIERFRNEVRTAAQLLHPNIVTAFDADQAGDLHFLTMEHVEGATLEKVVEEHGPAAPSQAREWVRQIALGLHCAHQSGMVHRDLKPSNVIRTAGGSVKVLDFGLARFASEQRPSQTDTPSGAVIGTPAYMAPEQALDPHGADGRADLYSLGCTWYFLLTGQPPFPKGTVLQQLLAHQDKAPVPLAHFRADVPERDATIIARLLQKEPERRYQTPQELLAALDAPGEPRSLMPGASKRRHKWIVGMAGALFALVLLAGFAGWSGYFAGHQEAPNNLPQPVPDAHTEAPRTSARDQAVAWLKANGTIDRVVEDMAREIDRRLAPGKAFTLRLGPRLVKSGRATLLAGRQHDFFRFEYPGDYRDVSDLGLALAVTDPQKALLHTDPPVRLADVKVDDAMNIDGDGKITGSVRYLCQRPVEGKTLCVRLTLMWAKRTATHCCATKQLAKEGTLSFAFEPLFADGTRDTGGHVLFFDLCSVYDLEAEAPAQQLSNTVAEMIVVKDRRK